MVRLGSIPWGAHLQGLTSAELKDTHLHLVDYVHALNNLLSGLHDHLKAIAAGEAQATLTYEEYRQKFGKHIGPIVQYTRVCVVM